jgi:hypothetical protein
MLAARLKGTTDPHGLNLGELVRGVVVRDRPFAAVAKPGCQTRFDRRPGHLRPSQPRTRRFDPAPVLSGELRVQSNGFVRCLDAPQLPGKPAKRGEPIVRNFRCDVTC